jgi:hypothetical protein
VIGLTPDNHSERDEAVVLARFRRRRDGARQLQRARHGQLVNRMAGLLQGALGPRDQHVVEMLVEAGFDDQEAGHGYSG